MPVTAVAPQFIRSRPARPARVRHISWLSGRSMLLHLTLIVVTPVCLLAGWWQLQRALSGNTLSFVYVFEWPAFAGVAVWSWWALLTAPTRSADPVFPGRPASSAGGGVPAPPPSPPGGSELLAAPPASSAGSRLPAPPPSPRGGSELLAARAAPLRWDPAEETGRLRAYNAYLAELSARPRRGRLPRRPSGGASA